MRGQFICFLAAILPIWAEQGFAQAGADMTAAREDAGDISPLRRLHDYFAQTAEIEFQTSFRETSDLPGMGRRGTAHFFIRKPNSFRVELSSTKGDYIFISDGTTFTMYRPEAGRYARIPANDSIVGTMYTAIGLLGTQAKLIDFIWTMDYGEQLTRKALGPETIGGKTCDRFNVRRFERSWDVWLEREGLPVPCRIVTRALDANDRSMQTNEFQWIADPVFNSELFVFAPQKDAQEVSASELE